MEKDQNGNTLNPNHISVNSKNNLVYGNERKIATVDIEDTIVVDTGEDDIVRFEDDYKRVQ